MKALLFGLKFSGLGIVRGAIINHFRLLAFSHFVTLYARSTPTNQYTMFTEAD